MAKEMSHRIASNIRKKAKGLGVILEGDLNHLRLSEYDGSPNTALSGELFELCHDYTNNDVYINTDGSTAWTKILD